MAKKQLTTFNNESEGGENGESGKGGEIKFTFHDTLSGPQREDLLPENEKTRLLKLHEEIHKIRVVSQKQKREQRLISKENQQASFQVGLGKQHFTSTYKIHPISNKAQFSGIDKQTNSIPSLNETEKTNEEPRNELQQQYNLQFHPEYPGRKNRLQLRRY